MTPTRSTALVAILAGTLALLWLAMFMLGTGDVDLAILSALYSGDRPVLADSARLITLLGGWYFVTPVAAVAGLLVALRGKPRLGLILFVGTLIGRMLVELQKYQLGRLRPDQHPHLVNVYNLSFPSGHSANAMMVYLAMAMLLATDERKRVRWTVAALVVTLLVGLSRVMLGVHWPSDVIAGWSFGAMWVLVMLWFALRTARPARHEGRG